MEERWPPIYDEAYSPDPKEGYWFKDRETMDPEEREKLILEKIRAQMAYAWRHAAFYQKKGKEAGLEPEDIKTLEDFHKVPVVTKQEIRRDQAEHPPFGSYLCIPRGEVIRVHGTSGTTGKPTAFAIGREDWRRIANAHARIMWGFGPRPSDTLFIGSFFSLYLGSWGALVGAERLGMTAFPFGAGVPGQTAMAVRWIKEVKPIAFYGTPSYGLYLAEVARKEGIDPKRDFHFRIMFFPGEPGAGIPSTKRLIEETYGAICIDTGSTAEMTPWMTNGECEFRHGMHLWQDIVFTELLDPETKEVVPYGGEGVPVYTHLERTSQPMIRFWSGDLSTWTDKPCECGRTYPRLPKGVYGRVDDMFIIRGENIYPSVIEDVLRSSDGFGEEFRIIISREEIMDELLVQAEYNREIEVMASRDPALLANLKIEMERKLRAVLGVRAKVKLLPIGQIPRTEFKARRVVDNRDLFKELRSSGSKGRTMDEMERIQREHEAWEETELKAFLKRRSEKKPGFKTLSGFEVNRLYTPLDLKGNGYLEKLGFPGRYPFTRGPYPTMYRARTWTMRQIAGFGTAKETNQRFRFLIEQGQTGLSIDFDMPTLMGYDSDDPRAYGEVGREGVAVDTLADMETLLEGIDLGGISVSMTINPTAWVLLAMYLAVAENQGIPFDRLSGTIQNDIVKEYIAQKEWIFPIRPSMRIVRDTITYGAKYLPHYNPVNISGYHIREAGATAVQEVAFTLASGIAYVEEVLKTGMDVDTFAPRLSFYFISHSDFFEEIAKFRAARRVWAQIVKERFTAKNPESMRLRFHCQTSGAALTAAQPMNNIMRVTIQALAAVLGGCQSLHTNGMDEALAIPSEEAMRIALRTQQILEEETGVINTIDPLGGSYFVEHLTDRIEEGVWAYLRKIDDLGGTLAAIEKNLFQREIADAAYAYQQEKERGERVVVGVNKYRMEEEGIPFTLHKVGLDVERRQIEHLQRVKEGRDNGKVQRLLKELQAVAKSDENLMPITLECVKAYATEGEIVKALVEVFGRYQETPIF